MRQNIGIVTLTKNLKLSLIVIRLKIEIRLGLHLYGRDKLL